MSQYYSLIDLSENMKMSDDGYLYCIGAPIARTGDLKYTPEESGIESKTNFTIINRTAEDLFNEETISSFEGKPITLGHPTDGTQLVDSENWRKFAVGEMKNVRQGEGLKADKLLTDMIIRDKEAIDIVLSKKARQVSLGYTADFIKTGEGRGRQTNMRGNHSAIVEKGRCGSQCAIFDSAPKKMEEEIMSVSEKIKRAIGIAVDSAIEENEPVQKSFSDEMASAISKVNQRIDDIEAKIDGYMSSSKGVDADLEQDEEDKKQDDRLSTIMDLVSKISEKMFPVKDEAEAEEKTRENKKTSDADTLCRAEILCPGIEDGDKIKTRALKYAYSTGGGKAVIDSLMGGKTFSETDENMLFISASEILKAQRMEKANSIKKSFRQQKRRKIIFRRK